MEMSFALRRLLCVRIAWIALIERIWSKYGWSSARNGLFVELYRARRLEKSVEGVWYVSCFCIPVYTRHQLRLHQRTWALKDECFRKNIQRGYPFLFSAWLLAWAMNGDFVSKQYAGTSALKGDFTRHSFAVPRLSHMQNWEKECDWHAEGWYQFSVALLY